MSTDRAVLDDALVEMSRTIVAAVVRSLASVDPSINVPQLRVLVMLWAGEGLNVNAVAEGLGVNASNASRACDRLVRAGLIRRQEDRTDRRRVVLSLTPRGRRLVDSVMARRRAELATVVDRMSAADRRVMAQALEAFNRAAATDQVDSSQGGRDQHLLTWVT